MVYDEKKGDAAGGGGNLDSLIKSLESALPHMSLALRRDSNQSYDVRMPPSVPKWLPTR